MTTTFAFDTTELPTLEQAGGKALALIEMTNAGMPVPPGFVLTVDFFKPWVDILKGSLHWSGLTTAAVNQIRQTARLIQELSQTLTFNTVQKDELEQALTSFRKSNQGHLYAVRSSSPE